MDALDRLAPVAAALLRLVDTALSSLGAPPDHPIWPLLRRVGATPADAVAHLAATEPARLRATADALRVEAGAVAALVIPAGAGWAGAAGAAYAVRAATLAAFLDGPQPDTIAGRLRATASYVDEIGDWQRRAREGVARALADVLHSAQAAVVLAAPRPMTTQAVGAAADIGARLLTAVAEAIEDGRRLADAWGGRLDELPPVTDGTPDTSVEATLRVAL